MDWAFSNYASVVNKVASECPKESVVIYKPDGRGLWRSAATWRWTVRGKRLRWENLIHVKPYITLTGLMLKVLAFEINNKFEKKNPFMISKSGNERELFFHRALVLVHWIPLILYP